MHASNNSAAQLDRSVGRPTSGTSSASGASMAGAPTSLTQWNSLQQQSAEQVDINKLLESIRATLRTGGIMAWVTLGLNLERAFAQSENAGLGKGSVKRVFQDSSVSLSDVDARAIVRYIAQDDHAKVSSDAIKNLVCGALVGRRLDLVQSVFEQLDRKHVGYVAVGDIVAAHDASRHPSVMFSEKSVEQVRDEFVRSFHAATTHVGGTAFVNLYQWMSYFQYVGGHVPSDEYFELLMKRVWKATTRTTLSDVTTASGSNGSSSSSSSTGAPMTLLQALHENNPAIVATYSNMPLSVSSTQPPPAPSGLLSTTSSSSRTTATLSDGISPRAAHSTTEFLKSAQFAACMADPSMQQPSLRSSNSNYVRRSNAVPSSPHGSAAATTNSTRPAIDAGTTSVLNRVRATIRDRGLRSLVDLSRSLRLSDDDSDGFVTLAEFKRAIGSSLATNVQLSDVDLRCLFNHLDHDRRNVVALHAALDLIRAPMNYRRFQLVQAAFAAIDRDGSGRLEPSEIVQAYDASKHPDVISGRKNEDDVFHEFLESFDVDADSSSRDAANSSTNDDDGKISFQQWEQYYQNVSFFVADDDFFDLMVRNTWQLTHLALDDDALYSSAALTAAGGMARNAAAYRVQRGTGHGSSQAFAILQPDLSDQHYEQHQLRHNHASSSSNNTGSSSSSNTNSVPGCMFAANKQTKALRRIITQLRAALKDQGVVGFISLQRAFRRMDDDANGSINMSEFQRALYASNLHVAPHDVASLFQFFDTNHDNSIDLNEFMAGIREPMSDRRMLFVRMAFDIIDKDSNGVLDINDIVGVYDARKHPDVLSGRKTEHDVFAEFLDTFDVDGIHNDSKITFADWTRYYANVSASIDDDDYFELMMRNAWHISGGTGWCANSTTRRVLVTGDDGVARVQEVHNDIGVGRDDVARVLAKQLGGAAATVRSSFFDVLDHTNTAASTASATTMRRARGNASDGLTACLNMASSSNDALQQRGAASSSSNNAAVIATATTTTTTHAAQHEASLASATVAPKREPQHPVGVQLILSRLQAALKARGAHGFCGLSRKFRLMDDDQNGSLNVNELRHALRDLELELSDADARLLFTYFDRDRSGSIDLNEFLAGVRDPLSDRRVFFVREAFRLMDIDGNGLLEPSDIVEAYDASRHPDVLSGHKTPDAVCREFLETFDVDGIHNGKITWTQWLHYYENVSASIDDDDYFELMMRNAWHISGGTGWCANSTTRRVLVTLADGTDVVREVRNDLGVQLQDVQARLQLQDRQSGIEHALGPVMAFTSSLNLTDPPATVTAAAGATASPPVNAGLAVPPNGKRIVTLREASSAAPMVAASSTGASSNFQSPPSPGGQGDVVFYMIQHRVRQKRVGDIVQLRKRALQYIDAKTGSISALHCSECLSATLGLALTEESCVALFAFIHQIPEALELGASSAASTIGARFVQRNAIASSNRIAIRKLFDCVLGKLSPVCLDAASRVFSALQAAGKGRVFPAALAKSFQAQCHPDVRFGGASATTVFQEFAASFEVSGSSDGAITFEHFEAYCVNLRVTLGSDELLQLILRDCFRAES